jgi:hypothetical protein
MSGASDTDDAGKHSGTERDEPVAYPERNVVAVLDTREQMSAAVAALTGGGFLPSEIRVETGADRADAVDASPGRGGLAGLLIRLAEHLGMTDEEMELKNIYEQAMRDDLFVLAVLAPSAERREHAADILRAHGGRAIAYHGKRTIELMSRRRTM